MFKTKVVWSPGKNTGPGIRGLTGPPSTIWPWISHFLSLCLGFPICKRRALSQIIFKAPMAQSNLKIKCVPACQPDITLSKHICSAEWLCFPHTHNWRYFLPEVTISPLTYPISFKVSSFCFEVQRKRRLRIMRMAPLKCTLRSCKLGGSCSVQRRGGYCDADVLQTASAARTFPWVFTVFLLLFIEHNVNEAINFTPPPLDVERR